MTETTTRPRKPGPRPRDGVREQLLRAGLRVMHARGYSATGISDITEAAGVAKGSFYHYFASKEVFGAEAADSYFARNAGSPLQPGCALPAAEQLQRFFTARMHYLSGHGFVHGCFLGNLSLDVSDWSEPIRARIAVHFAQWGQDLALALEQGQADGSIRRDRCAAQMGRHLVNGWQGALLRMRVEKTAQPLQDFLDLTLAACKV